LLRGWLEQHSEWEVCGEAENGQIAVESVKQLHPDIVILDLQMPVMNGLEAARQIHQFAPGTAMVMFTVYNSDQLQKAARANGVKDCGFEERSAGRASSDRAETSRIMLDLWSSSTPP